MQALALFAWRKGGSTWCENNSLDDSATHYPDKRAGVERIRAGNTGAWNDAMSLVIMP